MSVVFPSKEWLQAFKEEINHSPEYKQSGKTWEHGTMALIIQAEPDRNVPSDFAIWMDLYHGECLEMREVPLEEAQQAKFVITAPYTRWKQVMKHELEPVKGMMQGKLKLKGDLPTIVRYVQAAKDLVNCGTKPQIVYPDEN